MEKPTLAAQLYTLREQMKTPEKIREGLKKVAGMGYTSVQVSGIGPIEPTELRRYLDESGLSVCATHVPLDSILNDTETTAKNHKILGCPVVGIGAGPNMNKPGIDTAFMDDLAGKLNEAGRKLKPYGLRFGYHNHSMEFRKLENGQIAFDYLAAHTDPETVSFILDTYWVQTGGASVLEYIKRLRGRVDVIHFKDMKIGDDFQGHFAEIGAGNLNWKDIVAACEETGVKAAAIEQDICPRDPFDCLRASYEYLHRNFGLR